MPPRKITLVLGGGFIVFGAVLHFATCEWTSKNRLAGDPLITLKNGVTVDEQKATEWRIALQALQDANKQAEQVRKEIDSLAENAPTLKEKLKVLNDPILDARNKDALWQTKYWLQRMDETGPYAFGKFGVYPRSEKMTALILGFVVPVMLLIAASILLVWSRIARQK